MRRNTLHQADLTKGLVHALIQTLAISGTLVSYLNGHCECETMMMLLDMLMRDDVCCWFRDQKLVLGES
jgi:hypothetical protein